MSERRKKPKVFFLDLRGKSFPEKGPIIPWGGRKRDNALFTRAMPQKKKKFSQGPHFGYFDQPSGVAERGRAERAAGKKAALLAGKRLKGAVAHGARQRLGGNTSIGGILGQGGKRNARGKKKVQMADAPW